MGVQKRLEESLRLRNTRRSPFRDISPSQAAADSQTSLALKTEKLKLEAQRVTVLQQREKLRTYPSPARRFTNMIKRKVGERVYRHRGRSAPHTRDTRLLPEQKAKIGRAHV